MKFSRKSQSRRLCHLLFFTSILCFSIQVPIYISPIVFHFNPLFFNSSPYIYIYMQLDVNLSSIVYKKKFKD